MLLAGHAPQGFLLAVKPGLCSTPQPDRGHQPLLGQGPAFFHFKAYQLVAWPVLMALKALPFNSLTTQGHSAERLVWT